MGESSPSTDSAQRPKLRSVADPATVTVPRTLAPEAGEVNASAGAVVSTTVMVDVAVLTLADASRAVHVTVVRPSGRNAGASCTNDGAASMLSSADAPARNA